MIRRILFYPVSTKLTIAAIPVAFAVGYVGARLYRRWDLAKHEVGNLDLQDEILEVGEYIGYDDAVHHITGCWCLRSWCPGNNAEEGDITTEDVRASLCSVQGCEIHNPPEMLDKYDRDPVPGLQEALGRPQHGAEARAFREYLGAFAETIGLGTESIPSEFDQALQKADEHEYCYDLQRRGHGASTCLVDGDNPELCPHFHEWDITVP